MPSVQAIVLGTLHNKIAIGRTLEPAWVPSGTSLKDVQIRGVWESFTSANVLTTFGHLLSGTLYGNREPNVDPSATREVETLQDVHQRLGSALIRTFRRCLRHIFQQNLSPHAAGNDELIPSNAVLSRITHDDGRTAIGDITGPDYIAYPEPGRRTNRLPGVCMADWQWRADWGSPISDDVAVTDDQKQQYTHTMRRLCSYMEMTGTRYVAPEMYL